MPNSLASEEQEIFSPSPGETLEFKVRVTGLPSEADGTIGPPVCGEEILFSSPDGALVFPEGQTAKSDENGLATVKVKPAPMPGCHPLEASLRLPDGRILKAAGQVYSCLSASGRKQLVESGLATPEPLSIIFKDENGQPRKDVAVRFFCEDSCQPLELSATSLKSDASGRVEIFAKGADTTGKSVIRAEILSDKGSPSIPFEITTVSSKGLFFDLCGRFALFYLGLILLSHGLRESFATKLKALVHGVRRRPLNDLIIGGLVTALVLSSGATTDMVVGFVNAGLLSLSDSAALMLGCNVGSTIFPQLLACRLTGIIMPSLLLGALFYLCSRTRGSLMHALSRVFLGLGLVFLGLDLLVELLAPLGQAGTFDVLGSYFNCEGKSGLSLCRPFVFCLGSCFLLTALTRSSGATVGFLVILGFCNVLNLASLCPMILGCNLGKSALVIFTAWKATRSARRVALVHTLFNFSAVGLGTLLFFISTGGKSILLTFFEAFFGEGGDACDMARQAAWIHTIFNLFTAFALLPFSQLIVKLSEKILPVRSLESEHGSTLDNRLLLTPSLAFFQLRKVTADALSTSATMLSQAHDAFLKGDFSNEEAILSAEEKLDKFQREVSSFLTWFSEYNMDKEYAGLIPAYIHVAHDIERIGDIAVNYLHMAKTCQERDLMSRSEVRAPLEEYFKAMEEYCMEIEAAFHSKDHKLEGLTAKLVVKRKILQQLEEAIQTDYDAMSGSDMRSVKEGVLIGDSLTVMSRIVRHLYNVAERLPKLLKS